MAYLLMRAFRWFERGVQETVDLTDVPDLTPAQLMLLASLGPDGARLSDLARALGVSRQAVHQMVHELVRHDLVELIRDPNDARVRRARLTEAGRRLDDNAVAAIHARERALEARIGKRRLAALRDALESDWG